MLWFISATYMQNENTSARSYSDRKIIWQQENILLIAHRNNKSVYLINYCDGLRMSSICSSKNPSMQSTPPWMSLAVSAIWTFSFFSLCTRESFAANARGHWRNKNVEEKKSSQSTRRLRCAARFDMENINTRHIHILRTQIEAHMKPKQKYIRHENTHPRL